MFVYWIIYWESKIVLKGQGPIKRGLFNSLKYIIQYTEQQWTLYNISTLSWIILYCSNKRLLTDLMFSKSEWGLTLAVMAASCAKQKLYTVMKSWSKYTVSGVHVFIRQSILGLRYYKFFRLQVRFGEGG